MSKPEYCWINPTELADIEARAFFKRPADLQLFFMACAGDTKWRIVYDESGEVIRLERVEG